ncbi:hypothetical protein GA0070606_6152 [Micromonospora citrea]|uniref:Uncharacterized protein n=1 Tax=Micromonospora citrea TaxID=47855 RepID=A0A1C6W1W0_9ACTN|nr:hypothetical protein [Micromonospora citrea]SCL72521.1 hypothetical protein GA0070606_6152 [Micromonospora citrea]
MTSPGWPDIVARLHDTLSRCDRDTDLELAAGPRRLHLLVRRTTVRGVCPPYDERRMADLGWWPSQGAAGWWYETPRTAEGLRWWSEFVARTAAAVLTTRPDALSCQVLPPTGPRVRPEPTVPPGPRPRPAAVASVPPPPMVPPAPAPPTPAAPQPTLPPPVVPPAPPVPPAPRATGAAAVPPPPDPAQVAAVPPTPPALADGIGQAVDPAGPDAGGGPAVTGADPTTDGPQGPDGAEPITGTGEERHRRDPSADATADAPSEPAAETGVAAVCDDLDVGHHSGTDAADPPSPRGGRAGGMGR